MQKLMDQIQQPAGLLVERVQALLLPQYQQLELREQRLVLGAAVLLPVFILLFGIVLPMQDRQKMLLDDLAALSIQVAEAERIADQLVAQGVQQQAAGKRPANLMSAVEGLARQSGVREFMTRIRPQNQLSGTEQRLLVQLKNVPYKPSITFVHALARKQLGLVNIKMQAGKSSGLVHMQAVISSP